MHILHLEPEQIPDAARRKLEGAGAVRFVPFENQDRLREELSRISYGAVFVRLGLEFGRAEFELCPDLKVVVTPTTGLDHIDLEEAAARGVEVIHLRGKTDLLERIPSTAELTWALVLAVVRKLPFAFGSVVEGHWDRWPFEGEELIEQTLGIVGCGRLGRMVARYGLAFGMRVLAHDIDPGALARAPEGVRFVDLDSLLRESDVVSLHLPLNDSTEGYFSRACFEKMKPGAYLVNTARGELVDEEALLEALRGKLAGAGLDVVRGDSRWDDGVPPGHPLVEHARTHRNLVLTPHIGGCSITATHRTRAFVVDAFLDFLAARPADEP